MENYLDSVIILASRLRDKFNDDAIRPDIFDDVLHLVIDADDRLDSALDLINDNL